MPREDLCVLFEDIKNRREEVSRKKLFCYCFCLILVVFYLVIRNNTIFLKETETHINRSVYLPTYIFITHLDIKLFT